MKPYIKHFAQASVFVAGLLALLLLISQIFVPKDNNKDAGMIEESANGILAEKGNTIDVLFIGDSECYSSFIPLQLWKDHGITSYNCGTSLQTLYQTKEYLLKTFASQSPKVVILETNAIYRKFSKLDLYVNRTGKFFSVFDHHNRWKSLKAKDWSFEINYTHIENGKGYRYSTLVSETTADGYMAPTDNIKNIPKQNIRLVEEIKAFCDEHGAKLVLVSTPSTKNWDYERHNGITKFADELGVEYIDMNLLTDEIPIDWSSDTRDKGDHLNYSGASKVTEYMGKYIYKQNLFNDKRNNPEYDIWNDYSDSFLSSINK